MLSSFQDILSRSSIFRDRNVLSLHYIPSTLPHREKEINNIMSAISPALKGEKPRSIFIYGKTGTGKTSSVKYVMERFEEMKSERARMCYVNCRMYNTRYRVFHKLMKDSIPEYAKTGYGLSFFYEKLIDLLDSGGTNLIIVLDEVDMVKDLDDLIYTLTRANDDLKKGGSSIIGISNRLSFKDNLDPRSKSTLYETEMVFPPYTSNQLKSILDQRVKLGFSEAAVDESAINLAAAIAAQDNGDARYALKLILRAGEIVDEEGAGVVSEKHVNAARRSVDEDVSIEAISTLPQHQQIVLYSIATLSMDGGRYSKLTGNTDNYLLSGEVYENYLKNARNLRKEPRSSRWYREYLNELEMLGLINTVESGKGMRGHTRLIKIAYSPTKVRSIIERIMLE
ncbi:MAG: Origin of replication recognition protein Cdc6 [Candidatus Fermentimicrarchaeum limneticum]|uniref:ORC1-type DNA replication protein n=1 Tax=Fermentimicrarchaeum limneticum TaxID=2795018 RepID=A0A7D6BBN9_FERL1|nr:MAG: Origin of replication recognition protein Cdc6 [Candidatus Fermentimicrarchaeum limneticum]